MSLAEIPFLARLERSRSVLIAGAGGGFDVFCGLPLYLHLRALGKQVHLANLSFSNLVEVRAHRLHRHAIEVTADSGGSEHYFPERALARWFRARGDTVSIYAFEKVGCRPLLEAYRAVQAAVGFDAVVLVDGGTDILMRGDEAGLGTPEEDITSLAAVHQLDVAEKLVVCLGFGVDRHHGVCHAHFLEAVAALSRERGFLGTLSLLRELPEVAAYLEAVAFSSEQMPRAPSIVSLSISSAIEGEYGDVHRTHRTRGSKLWINPLMQVYWAFDLGCLARRCLYLDDVSRTDTAFEVSAIIEGFRIGRPVRSWEDIPV